MNDETTNDTMSIEISPNSQEETFEPSPYLDNRTAVVNGSMVDNTLLACEAKRVGTSPFNPMVHWIRNGELILNTTGVTSSLEITSFTVANAGVYQCIFIDDDMDAEIVTTIPYKVDTGMFLM